MRYGMLIDLTKCVGCNACTVACRNHNGTPSGVSLHKIMKYEVGKFPHSKMKFLPMPCMQCENAPCEKACPIGATVKRPDGIVEVLADQCMGCRGCVTACPYDARQFVWEIKNYYEQAPVTLFEKKRHKEYQQGTVVKCTFCLNRLEKGLEPACVTTCPSQCRVFGDLDDPSSELSKAIAAGNARPFREDLETNPSVYYING